MDFAQYQSLLHDCAQKLRKAAPLPLRLGPICRELGVTSIRRARLASGRSLLVDAGTAPKILIGASTGPTVPDTRPFSRTERFLIAHELAHLLLHQANAKKPFGVNEYWKVEQLCDAFARHLLIPDEMLVNFANHAEPTAVSLLRSTLLLVREAGVPWSVAARRTAEFIPDTAFFGLSADSGGGYKVVVSTFNNKRGIGQLIKCKTTLCSILDETLSKAAGKLIPVDRQKLLGLAGMTEMDSGAAYATRRHIRLAIALQSSAQDIEARSDKKRRSA